MLDHEAGDTDVSGTVDGQRRGHATSCMKKAEKFLVAASPRTTMRWVGSGSPTTWRLCSYWSEPHPGTSWKGFC